MMKSISVGLAVLAIAIPLSAKKPAAQPELCDLRTVTVTGNSESAVHARQNLTKWSWLEPAPAESADVVLAIEEREGAAERPVGLPNTGTKFVVSATLTRKGKSEPVWSGFGESDLGSKIAVMKLFTALWKDAGCRR